jgi:histidinol phosphatase-like enzyme
MIRRAMEEWRVCSEGSFLIGDKPSDAEAAAAAGIRSMLIEPNVGDLAGAVRMLLAS